MRKEEKLIMDEQIIMVQAGNRNCNNNEGQVNLRIEQGIERI